MQRLLPPQLFLICAAATGAVGWFVPVLTPLAGPLRLAGLPLLVVAVVLTMRSAAVFDRVRTNIKTFDDPQVLVEQEAFRFSRNPMYLGFTLALVAMATLVGSVTAFVGPAAFWASADRWYIPFEERRMRAVFGPAYDDYCLRVPRWAGRRRQVPAPT